MPEHVVHFYKSLFGREPSSNVKLGVDFWEEDELVSTDENGNLEAPFSLKRRSRRQFLALMLKVHLGLMASLSFSIKPSGTLSKVI